MKIASFLFVEILCPFVDFILQFLWVQIIIPAASIRTFACQLSILAM